MEAVNCFIMLVFQCNPNTRSQSVPNVSRITRVLFFPFRLVVTQIKFVLGTVNPNRYLKDASQNTKYILVIYLSNRFEQRVCHASLCLLLTKVKNKSTYNLNQSQ